MTEIRKSVLPGVGLRYEFTTRAGRRLEVVAHRSGRREIYVGHPDDPDSFERVLQLHPEDAATVAEILGGSQITEELRDLRQTVEGLAIDWLPVDPDSPYAGRTIGDTRARTRTGVSIVAVMRSDRAFPAPGPEFILEPMDTTVVVGTPRGIESLVHILHAG